MAVCPNCGKMTFSGADYCYYCGARVNNNDTTHGELRQNFGKPVYNDNVYEKETKYSQESLVRVLIAILILFLTVLLIAGAALLILRNGPALFANNSNKNFSGSSIKATDLLAFEKGGVEVYFRCWAGENSSSDPCVELFVSNKSDRDILLLAQDTTIDGNQVSGVLYEKIPKGKNVKTAVSFSGYELKVYGITTPEEIQMKFSVLDASTGDRIYSSDLFCIKT